MSRSTLAPRAPDSILAPLGKGPYRATFIGSMLTNFGSLIQGVGAAWEMTRLTDNPEMVALVQTAIMLPVMLAALPAGAVADMLDRRRIALIGLSFAALSGGGLTLLTLTGHCTPWVLLGGCFSIGIGVAIYAPAWQSSVSEQVQPEHLPSAISLNSINFNVARSFGPAIGGAIVATAGAVAAFAVSALLYLPLIGAFFAWKRDIPSEHLRPERIDRAIVGGCRYVFHTLPVRVAMLRTLLSWLAGASLTALMPLVAKTLLGGDAGTYGFLLASFGVGAVGGAFLLPIARQRLRAESIARGTAIIVGLMAIVTGLSSSLPLTSLAMVIAGGMWTLKMATYNVTVQLCSPRWVTARAMACFQTAITTGVVLGAWGWGNVAQHWGVADAMIISGIVICLTPLAGLLIPMTSVTASAAEMLPIEKEPAIALELPPQSGPIVIEIDYRVAPEQMDAFRALMRRLRASRLRSGGVDWTLTRDLADGTLWVEQYRCPTWHDYLRQRGRSTRADRDLQEQARTFHHDPAGAAIRRRLDQRLR